MSIEFLYPLVSEAIRRAETLEDIGAPGAHSAYLDVSLLEEKISEAIPASDPEGALARRGAVRAALKAWELARVRQLAERFVTEAGEDVDLRAELLRLDACRRSLELKELSEDPVEGLFQINPS